MKVVINVQHGGYGLTDEAMLRLQELGFEGELCKFKDRGLSGNQYYYKNDGPERHSPLLIQVIEELGEKANGFCATLKIVEIPDETNYCIEEYDGYEWIAEVHKTWHYEGDDEK